MPRLADDTEKIMLPGGHFGFSALPLAKLGAAKLVLAQVAVDRSGSVAAFSRQMEQCLKQIRDACLLNPFCDNVLLRVTSFDDMIKEVHGFLPLAQINDAVYDGCLDAGSTTALYAAWEQMLDAGKVYAEKLVDGEYEVASVCFGITDGLNNEQPHNRDGVEYRLKTYKASEKLGSLTTVLIGVNAIEKYNGRPIGDVLVEFQTGAGIDQYVNLDDASPKTLAKLGQLVSRSISSASKALATGQPVPSNTSF